MAENNSFTYERATSDVDILSPINPIVLATVVALTPPASILASETDYGHVEHVFSQEHFGNCSHPIATVTAFTQADKDRCDILTKIAVIEGQMGDRDYRVAMMFVQNLPRDLFVESLGVDTEGYLTIGWELARFRGISVSFSGERIHVIGRLRAKKIAMSVTADSMESIYEQVRTVLYE